MSTIGRLLQAKEPLLDHALHQLEHLTHHRAVDVRLAADLSESAARASRELGLEHTATGPQLHAALTAQAARHDTYLASQLRPASDPDDIRALLPGILDLVSTAPIVREGWFLRPESAARLLRQQPPMAIMERLGYHLVSALLDHEDLVELYLAIRFVESPEWLTAFNRQYLDLTAADFEPRAIDIRALTAEKWGDIADARIQSYGNYLTHSKEMGAIAVLPTRRTHQTGFTLATTAQMLHYHNEIRHYSSFFKLIAKKQNFGAIIADTLNADPAHLQITDGAHIHWRVISRYYGRAATRHPEIFEPHVQPEDLHWRGAEATLADSYPELAFWSDLDYVAVVKGHSHDIVTFNLIDIVTDYANTRSYDQRELCHFRDALWNELFARYFSQPVLEEQLLLKLDTRIIKPEVLTRP